MSQQPPPRYRAFISYSHQDARDAHWLHRALESYRVPASLRLAAPEKSLPSRVAPVFIDRAELSSSADLGKAVIEALAASDALVVICSAASARSKWVNDEVRRFKAGGKGARIFCLIVGGRASIPDSAEMPADLCFAPALIHEVDPDGQITTVRSPAPAAADLRPRGDGRRDAKLKIIAGLLGVSFDQLRRREDASRNKRYAFVGIAAALTVATLALALVASVRARHEAEQQRLRAEQESLKATQTADFMKSLFDVADPSESRGNAITAREILDRGAARIDSALDHQPAVRASLLTTLGQVYTSLGLYPRSITLLTDARATQARVHAAPTDIMLTTVSLADAQYMRGEYTVAESLYRDVIRAAGADSAPASPTLSRAWFGLGEALVQREVFPEADAAYRRALQIDRSLHETDHVDIARSISGLARSQFYQGNLEQGATLFRESLAMRRKLLGEDHPRVGEDLNALASIEYLRGDHAAAARDFSVVLRLFRKIYGEEHPETATAMNNMARVQLEERNFAPAYDLLRASVRIDQLSKDALHDDFAFSYDSLGLASMGAGRLEEAEQWFNQALEVERKHKHRMYGPTLTNLADLECRRGRYQAGLDLMPLAQAALRADYKDEAWRIAVADSVRGACLLGLGQIDAAERLLRSSDPVIHERWGASQLFARDATNRLTVLEAARRHRVRS